MFAIPSIQVFVLVACCTKADLKTVANFRLFVAVSEVNPRSSYAATKKRPGLLTLARERRGERQKASREPDCLVGLGDVFCVVCPGFFLKLRLAEVNDRLVSALESLSLQLACVVLLCPSVGVCWMGSNAAYSSNPSH